MEVPAVIIAILIAAVIYCYYKYTTVRRLLDKERSELPARIKKEKAQGIAQSRTVIKGQIAEQMFGLLSHMHGEYALQDMFFAGKLFDYLVVDGYSDVKDHGGNIKNIVFIDVKTGNAELSAHQQKLKEAIEAGRVIWRTARITSDGKISYEDVEPTEGTASS